MMPWNDPQGVNSIAPPETVAIDIGGAEAAAVAALFDALADLARGTPAPQPEVLAYGLRAVSSVSYLLQMGGGPAGASPWRASLTRLDAVGRSLLTIEGPGQQIVFQLDSGNSLFIGTWQDPSGMQGGGLLSFSIEPGMPGSTFRVMAPYDFAIPLPSPIPGWTPAPVFAETPAGESPFGGGALAMGALAAAGGLLAGALFAQRGAPTPEKPAAAPPPPAPAAALGWSLQLTTGPQAGNSFALRGSLRIGRNPSNDIVIADPTVSQKHALVELDGGACVVRDLGSTNGTLVNGIRISAPTALRDGDVISCGAAGLAVAGPAAGGRHDQTLALKPEEAARLAAALRAAPAAGPTAASPATGPAFPATRPLDSLRQCPRCGAPSPREAKFCGVCGGTLGK